MENYCAAFGDDLKSFAKQLPQSSFVHRLWSGAKNPFPTKMSINSNLSVCSIPLIPHRNLATHLWRCAGGVHRGGAVRKRELRLSPSPMPHSLGTFLAEQESTAAGRHLHYRSVSGKIKHAGGRLPPLQTKIETAR